MPSFTGGTCSDWGHFLLRELCIRQRGWQQRNLCGTHDTRMYNAGVHAGMSVTKESVYLKLDRNSALNNRQVHLSDVGTLYCSNEAILRQIKQLKIYSFPDKEKNKKEYVQVMSAMKVIELIQQNYTNVDVVNIGEADFVMEYDPALASSKGWEYTKTAVLAVIIFFGAAFTIMAFNNDVGVTEVFAKFYEQVLGIQHNGVTELEICYSIGLPIGVLLFFNHFGHHKITSDPTPIQVEMRKYEKDVDDTFVENASRGGKTIDVD